MEINDTDGRVCTQCEVWKPFSEFYKLSQNRPGYRSKCKKCCNTKSMQDYYANHDNRKEMNRDRERANRDLVYGAYGNQCVCCGETNPFFLSIDHVNNDGNKHRRTKLRKDGTPGYSNTYLYREIIKNNYPDAYQLLCMNCNMGKQRNGGICPHALQNS